MVELKVARIMAGFDKQIEVAERLGVGQVTVSLWETRKIRPNKINRIRLATLYGVPEEKLNFKEETKRNGREKNFIKKN